MSPPPLALITGVSRDSGLGLEIARQLLARGMSVIITARSLAKAQAAATLLEHAQGRLTSGEVDVSSDASVAALASWVQATFGRLDVLINNAGGYYDQDATALTTEIQFALEAINVNALGAWRMSKALFPLLTASGHGRIVNVSSAAASFAGDGYFAIASGPATPAYAVSKLALNGVTIKLAHAAKGSGVLVNSVCPGFTATTPGLEKFGARPVSEGAAGVVWAATIPDTGPTGGFFRDGKPLGW